MIAFVVAVLLLAQAGGPRDPVVMLPPPDPATGRWTSHGPSGGMVYGIALDATDPQVAYAALGPTNFPNDFGIGGVFKTSDGGSSWREVGPPATSFFSVAVSHSEPSVLFASSQDQLWTTDDGGATWRMVLPILSYVDPAAIDPADAQHVWFVSNGSAWRSLDGGTTWMQMFAAQSVAYDSGVPSRLHRAQVIGFGPGDASELEFAYSDDQGVTWSAGIAFSQAGVRSIVSDPADPNKIYTADALFRSMDRGVSWTQLPNHTPIYGLAFDPRLPNTLYGVQGGGLAVSRDDGATWTEVFHVPTLSVAASAVSAGTRVFAGSIQGIFTSNDLSTWIGSSSGLRGAPWQSIALDPVDPSKIYSVGAEGFAASSNAGATWSEDLMSPAMGTAVAVDPSNPSRILATGLGHGIVRSRDAGATWDVVFSPSGPTSAIVFDHSNPSAVYTGVFYPIKSTDGGETWHGINHGVESFATSALVIDSGNSALLYMISVPSGGQPNFLFRSADAGENWVVDPGIRDHDVGTIQAILADPGRPGVVWVGTSYGVFRGSSSDTNWTATGFFDSVSAIAADASADGALYVASYGDVFRSLDEGATWEPMGTGLPPVVFYPQVVINQLLADKASGVLYAATNDGVYSLDLRRRPRVLPPR